MGPLVFLRRFLLTALVLFPSLGAAAVEGEQGWGLPRDVSLEGHRIDWLIQITMVFVGLLFVIMVVWMLIAVFKHDKTHAAQYDHGDSRHHVLVACALSSVIFFVVDGNLFVNSVVDLNQAFWNWERAAAPDAIRVQVNARQWAWDIRYAGADGEFNTPDDIVTLNDMRVPVDTPIYVQLTAVDVLHSFYLPNLRVKTDAVPGTVNHLWFQATQTGEFNIACAQHCGTHHYKMKGLLTILSKDEFKVWGEEAAINSALAYDPQDSAAHWGWKWEKI